MASLYDLFNAVKDAVSNALRVKIVSSDVSMGSDPVGLKNVAEDTINPATEDTAALIKAKTDNLDLALTSLRDALAGASPSNKTLADIVSELYYIKTADGIKKIVDPVTVNLITGFLTEAVFTGRLGEVQPSPTANTLLARLKDLLTGITLAAGTNAIGKLAANDGVDIGDVSVNNSPTVKPNALKKLAVDSAYSVDTTAVQVFDASANATGVAVIIANCGVDTIYLHWTNSVSATLFFKSLSPGESWEYPLGYTSDATNDIYAVRASAQTNDDVITTILCEV